jgi:hypothetical protein
VSRNSERKTAVTTTFYVGDVVDAVCSIFSCFFIAFAFNHFERLNIANLLSSLTPSLLKLFSFRRIASQQNIMAISFLLRPRSKKRFLTFTVMTLVLWYYIQPQFTTSISPVDYLTRPSIYSQMLDHVKKPLCPTFRKYDRQKLLLLDPNDCTSLDSKHPDFSADICFSPYTCNEGLVRVRRRDRVSLFRYFDCYAAESLPMLTTTI